MAHRVPTTHGRIMDDMDKMYDSHPWCSTKTTNIQNDFELSLCCSTCPSHLQFYNGYSDYTHRNGGVCNNTEWAGSTIFLFVMGNIAPTRSTIVCKVRRFPLLCIVLCHTQIIYIHSTFVGMSKTTFILVYWITM